MSDHEGKVRAVEDRFVTEWGRMSSSWGINRTMAQIHALLIITGREFSMDEIIDRLGISRGNASMNLRDLEDWSLVRRSRASNGRKDLYQAHGDILDMFVRVVRERKRRELDPTSGAIRDCLAMLPAEEDGEIRRRLMTFLELFDIIDAVYRRLMEPEGEPRQLLTAIREGKAVDEVL
ncbi:MAG: MarR family transcriptional regulator [Fimbriimonadaceae bacterium]|nr:MarR family transcriptional regulator [Fimbriimonadaceae bacterium]